MCKTNISFTREEMVQDHLQKKKVFRRSTPPEAPKKSDSFRTYRPIQEYIPFLSKMRHFSRHIGQAVKQASVRFDFKSVKRA